MSAYAVNTQTMPGSGRITQAIATASRRTGVDFAYLVGQAQVESSFNPDARASTSSATGLYQFLDQSWLKVINDHGSDYGMDWASSAIQQASNGRYYVSDPALRQQILDLRKHPETASVMAAEFASDNRGYLEQHIGRAADSTDLYLAHFLGAAGASKFLNAMAFNPNASAASIFPSAARANARIFYNSQGGTRSLGEIRNIFAQKLANGASQAGVNASQGNGGAGDDTPLPGNQYVQPADYVRIEQQRLTQNEGLANKPYPEMQATPATARLAYLMLATFGR